MGDASGYTMAQEIIRDAKELQPNAWVYWQPVEPDVPEYGWGLINANYIDTRDQMSAEKTPLVRVNRKFYVYGQFTRYLRPGYQLIGIDEPNSIAAYDRGSHSSSSLRSPAMPPRRPNWICQAFLLSATPFN